MDAKSTDTAVEGLCDTHCDLTAAFLLTVGIGGFFLYVTIVPGYIITLR